MTNTVCNNKFTVTFTRAAAAAKNTHIAQRTDLGDMTAQRDAAYLHSRHRLHDVLLADYEQTLGDVRQHTTFLRMMLGEALRYQVVRFGHRNTTTASRNSSLLPPAYQPNAEGDSPVTPCDLHGIVDNNISSGKPNRPAATTTVVVQHHRQMAMSMKKKMLSFIYGRMSESPDNYSMCLKYISGQKLYTTSL